MRVLIPNYKWRSKMKWVIAGLIGFTFLMCQGGVEEPKSTSPEVKILKTEDIKFVSHKEISEMGGYLLTEKDMRGVIELLKEDKYIKEQIQSGGGLEFPIPCEKLIKYIEELIGIELDSLKCQARGKVMFKPELDLWIAANLAYAIEVGEYFGAAGFAGLSASLKGVEEIGVFTQVYVNGVIDTLLWSYSYGEEENIAFNAGAVVWASAHGGVTLNITTDHNLSDEGYTWNRTLSVTYNFTLLNKEVEVPEENIQ